MTTAGLERGDDGVQRCWWGAHPAIYQRYHDEEWGMPTADDARLFEKLCLEGFQAGLSWLTILNKRARFREVFAGFEPERVAAMGEADVVRLLADPGIVRHRAKIEAAIGNAQRLPAVLRAHGSLARFIWQFEPGAAERPAEPTREALVQLTETASSRALAKALRGHGFRFIGPTTAYAFMQSVGLVNDHVRGCPARARCEAARRRFQRPR